MSKAKKGTKENPVNSEDIASLAEPKKRPYKILEAVIKDGLCHYMYEMIEGKGPYDKHKVEGKGLIKDDMRELFDKFRVHMAAIDGVFKLQGIEVVDIDQYHADDIVMGYHIDGFKIKGSDEMEFIILMGSKPIQECAARQDIITPRIDLTSLSGYKFYNELKALADQAREEVALYKEGKYTVIETEDDDDDDKKKRRPRQLNILSPEAAADNHEPDIDIEEVDDEFNNAQV